MKLREWREKNKLTQEQLAEMLGVNSDESISQWENGKNMPRKDVLIEIMNLTKGKVTANDFI